jgi:hypothetical protein
MSLGGEPRGAHVGHPDLHWPQSLAAQSGSMCGHPLANWRRGVALSHLAHVTCNRAETQINGMSTLASCCEVRSSGLTLRLSVGSRPASLGSDLRVESGHVPRWPRLAGLLSGSVLLAAAVAVLGGVLVTTVSLVLPLARLGQTALVSALAGE